MDTSKLDQLKKNFTGEVILPEDPKYAQVSNSRFFKGAPAIVARPKSAQDVAAAVVFAQDNGLIISIRSGGHSIAGLSTNKGGLVIDLSLMDQVEVMDPGKGLVKVGGGALWGNIGKQLQEHGLAISSGDTKTVGVGGLTLGGGVGWMVRKYGLAIDSLVGAEIVTADGQIQHLSEKENPDLFWAIRGGGGNFGVVTSFEFAAHPTRKVHAGVIMYQRDDLAGFFKGLRDYMRTADESLTIIGNAMAMGGPPGLMLMVCYDSPDKDQAMKAIDPLLKLAKVISQDIKEKFYYEVLEDAHPPGDTIKIIVRNAFIKELTDEIIEVMAAAFQAKPDLAIQFRTLGGAMRRFPVESTAFPYRDSEFLLLSPTFLPATATPEMEQQALAAWKGIEKYGTGAYCNFFSTCTPEDTARVYPKATYDRLVQVKKIYDPQNVFNQNYNVKP